MNASYVSVTIIVYNLICLLVQGGNRKKRGKMLPLVRLTPPLRPVETLAISENFKNIPVGLGNKIILKSRNSLDFWNSKLYFIKQLWMINVNILSLVMNTHCI